MSKTQKILYVEDEIFLGKIVKDSLETRNFEVMMLSEGSTAIEVFQSFRPDICILDIMLPNKDGYTIAEEIRKMSPTMPIIFLTAKSQTEDVLKGFQVGGNDYLRKPFSLEELIVRIQNLLNLTTYTNLNSTSKTEVITIGRYHFYPKRHELHLGKEVQKLSHREVELLSILAQNPNTIIERKEILLKVWKDDSFYNSRNLDVYITKLREHLKAENKVQIISLKGVGYRFLME